jgi:hypothetical protein
MEPAIREQIKNHFLGAGPTDIDRIYIEFIQYEIGIDPKLKIPRWRRYNDGPKTLSFGHYFMSCGLRHINYEKGKAGGAAATGDRVGPDVWVPMARFIYDHPLANENERLKWCGPLLSKRSNKSISSKQFEYIQAFWNRLKFKDTGTYPEPDEGISHPGDAHTYSSSDGIEIDGVLRKVEPPQVISSPELKIPEPAPDYSIPHPNDSPALAAFRERWRARKSSSDE